VVAAGFLIFVVGETLVLACAALDLVASAPLFAAGVGLWAATLALVSAPRTALHFDPAVWRVVPGVTRAERHGRR
jgi:hypothetical protein